MAGFEHASGQVDRDAAGLPPDRSRATSRSSSPRSSRPTSSSAGAGRGPAGHSSGCAARRSTACSAGSRASSSSDLGCGARAFDRRVLEEIQLYGDQHRFLAVLADRQGFRVREVDVRQSPKDRFEGIYQPREYTRGLLDIFTVFFLVRFTKKPLRFFGMVGVTTFAIGALPSPGSSSSACSSARRWPSGRPCCCRRCWSCWDCSCSRSDCSAN